MIHCLVIIPEVCQMAATSFTEVYTSYNVLRRHQDITNLLHQTVATWDHISEQTHQKEVAGMGVSQGMGC